MSELKVQKIESGYSVWTTSLFGLPLALFVKGEEVVSNHIGPGAEKRAWKSYHRYLDRLPSYELGSMIEPDMELPEELISG